jgi:6-phosphogluconolactonase
MNDLTPNTPSMSEGSPKTKATAQGHSPRIVIVSGLAFDHRVAESLAHALEIRRGEERIHMALAGGHTPRGGYRRLAQIPEIPWGSVDVFFGDERAVPPDDAESNYRMAMESLLARIPVGPDRIYRMEADAADRDAAAERYEHLLPQVLDVLVLGIGPDGHTASLFPGGEPVREATRRVLPAEGPEPPRHRLTITPPVILSAREVFVLARGAEKAPAVQRALEGAVDPPGCPAQLARSGTWILDEAAAARLQGAAEEADHGR